MPVDLRVISGALYAAVCGAGLLANVAVLVVFFGVSSVALHSSKGRRHFKTIPYYILTTHIVLCDIGDQLVILFIAVTSSFTGINVGLSLRRSSDLRRDFLLPSLSFHGKHLLHGSTHLHFPSSLQPIGGLHFSESQQARL